MAELEEVEQSPKVEEFDWRKQADRENEERAALERRVFLALFSSEDGNLVPHARRELERAGLFREDSDYSGMLGDAVLDLVRVFAAQGHSGFSAHMAIDLFRRVASYDVLTPLTSDPSEWNEVGTDVWQNRRKSSCFSSDGGKTWKDNEAPEPSAEVQSGAADVS